jgi:hypothetical protein
VLNRQPTVHEPDQHDAMLAFNRLLRVCESLNGSTHARTYLCAWLQVPLQVGWRCKKKEKM